MCLRFKFCTHQRVCILHFLKKLNLLYPSVQAVWDHVGMVINMFTPIKWSSCDQHTNSIEASKRKIIFVSMLSIDLISNAK